MLRLLMMRTVVQEGFERGLCAMRDASHGNDAHDCEARRGTGVRVGSPTKNVEDGGMARSINVHILIVDIVGILVVPMKPLSYSSVRCHAVLIIT